MIGQNSDQKCKVFKNYYKYCHDKFSSQNFTTNQPKWAIVQMKEIEMWV